ncbi:hypothetical protein KKG22_03895 [Patescibacteria group bacterium]|nr:hypothetical protein [Patescibacteria group bacterium]MBU1721286.1 hypothetical protein [Patescibacteria group bacterium]MBU1901006.1 hypothetical protein [Patescibacteria group bacterium]
MNYLFFLGNHPDLSEAEIRSVCTTIGLNPSYTRDAEYLLVESSIELPVEEMIDALGGTIKIAQQVEERSNDSDIVSYLQTQIPEGKIVFSLNASQKRGITLKKQLKESGRSVRFIEPKNTATILHNGLIKKKTDLTVYHGALYASVGLQPIEELSKRDYGRPGRDSKSGMLPPKLAKILINLSQTPQDKTLLDPFCGSGTVLMEAMTMGYQKLVGSDISPKAIEDSVKNIDWVKKTYTLEVDTDVFVADAQSLKGTLKQEKIFGVATEPYLGVPLRGHENRAFLEHQARELAELYTQTFKTLSSVMSRGGSVVFIIPQFRHNNGWITIDCIEDILYAGFEISPLNNMHDSLLYWRPGQYLGRMIWRFTKI